MRKNILNEEKIFYKNMYKEPVPGNYQNNIFTPIRNTMINILKKEEKKKKKKKTEL